jgi:putative nucleotidyltransferase with HDIG domain
VEEPLKHSEKDYLAALIGEVKRILGDEKSHGFAHAERTMDLAERISRVEGGDIDVIRAAALLHDIGRENIFGDPGHGKRGAEMSREILERLKVPWDVEKIVEIVARHDESGGGSGDEPIELVIVRDADRLELLRVSPEYLDLERLVTSESLRLVPYALGLHESDNDEWRHEAERTKKRAEEILRARGCRVAGDV